LKKTAVIGISRADAEMFQCRCPMTDPTSDI
jgi:hypothetical protein